MKGNIIKAPRFEIPTGRWVGSLNVTPGNGIRQGWVLITTLYALQLPHKHKKCKLDKDLSMCVVLLIFSPEFMQ